jgi:SAM-dependent methyltransferase
MSSCALDSNHAQQAYEAFAPYYDSFTGHHDLDGWIESLLALAGACGLSGRRVLDVGCGTGKSVLPLLARGFRVTACDHSAAMLDEARLKTAGRARLYVLDARELPVLGEFDLITAIGDVVNYLLEPSELEAMFRGVRANLASNGLAVFDANTLWMYGNFWAEQPSADAGEAKVSWQGVTGPGLDPGGLATARVHVLNDSRHETSVHYQRHHPYPVVERALSSAGLQIAALRGQFPDGRLEAALDETRHGKAIYLVRLRPSISAKGGEE